MCVGECVLCMYCTCIVKRFQLSVDWKSAIKMQDHLPMPLCKRLITRYLVRNIVILDFVTQFKMLL